MSNILHTTTIILLVLVVLTISKTTVDKLYHSPMLFILNCPKNRQINPTVISVYYCSF